MSHPLAGLGVSEPLIMSEGCEPTLRRRRRRRRRMEKKESCSDEASGRPLITKQLQPLNPCVHFYPSLKSPHTHSVTLSQPTAPLSACSLHERTWLLFYSFFPLHLGGLVLKEAKTKMKPLRKGEKSNFFFPIALLGIMLFHHG